MKTQVKNLFIIVGICSIFVAFTPTSPKFRHRDFARKNWIMQFPSPKDYIIIERYDGSTKTTNVIIGRDTTIQKSRYYLSNSLEEIFDPDKIFTLETGKYIILEDGEPSREATNPTRVYEIIALNKDSLVIQYVLPQGKRREILLGVPVTFKLL